MAELYVAFIRHAAFAQPEGVPSAHLPHPLTAEGRRQARALAGELVALSSELGAALHPRVHSSHLLRAWETAELARAALLEQGGPSLEVVQDPALAERCLGPMANLTVARIEELVAADPRLALPPKGWKATAHYRLPFPGCESLAEAGERVAGYVRGVARALQPSLARDTLVACVGHGASFRHAAASLGLFDYGDAAAVSMYYAKPVTLRAPAEGPWEHAAGAWKPRGAAAPRD
ncbi:MAG: histidine phosphatase family protein [Planctomycetes bacterium]|nr:histidine phosphatase family protein [Planctomycetota bacterium]